MYRHNELVDALNIKSICFPQLRDGLRNMSLVPQHTYFITTFHDYEVSWGYEGRPKNRSQYPPPNKLPINEDKIPLLPNCVI